VTPSGPSYDISELPFFDAGQLPEISAIYEVWSEIACLYIGCAANLRRRWAAAHHMAIRLAACLATRIKWTETPIDLLASAERALISKLRPQLNKTRGTTRERKSIPDGVIPLTREFFAGLDAVRLPADGYRLTLHIAGNAVPGYGFFRASNLELAEQFGIHRTRVSKLIGKLADAKLIYRVGPKTVLVNPLWCFRGTPKEHDAAVAEWGKLYPFGIISRQDQKAS
jgi:CRP-like cAMP-binding protein